DVDVERDQCLATPEQTQPTQPCFLGGLSPGDAHDVDIAIGVPSRLEPTLELTMVNEGHALPVGRNDPRRTGQVPWPTGAMGTVGMGLDQLANSSDRLPFVRVTLNVAVEEQEKVVTGHCK